MLRYLPNLLTLIRLVFALAMLLVIQHKTIIFYLFAIASVTDWLDGYLAKSYSLTSKIGEILDPIADKILVITALLILVHYHNSLLLVSITAIIILREFLISAMRQILVEKPLALKVSFLSRIKAACQMFGIGTCLFSLAYNHALFFEYGLFMIVISVFLTILTFISYAYKSAKTLELNL